MELFNTPELINLPEHIISALKRLETKVDQIHQNAQILNKPILDIGEAADLLRMSKFTLYTMTSKSIIPFFKVGRKIFFDRDELIDFVRSKNHRHKSIAEIESDAATHVITRRRG